MSTTYYATTDVCPCCKMPPPRLEIGSMPGGWAFKFRGSPVDCSWTHPLVGDGVAVDSWAAWKKILENPIVRIEDDCATRWTLQEFEELVTARRGGYSLFNPAPASPEPDPFWRDAKAQARAYERERSWLDAEGFQFRGEAIP